MLQVLLKSRFLFISCLVIVWISILTIPKFGQIYRARLQDKDFLEVQTEKDEEVIAEEHNSLSKSYPVETPLYLFAGDFQQGDKCLDTLDRGTGMQIGLFECHGAGVNQFWFLMKDSGWLKNKNLCVEGPTDLKKEGGPAILKPYDKIENQSWIYEKESIHLSGSTLCLHTKNDFIFVEKCNPSLQEQKFKLNTPPGF